MKTQNCSQCGNIMRLINAGISKKTGKPYKAFFSCPACGFTLNVPDDLTKTLPQQTPKVNRDARIEQMYKEKIARINQMHREKKDNINKGLAYKLATFLIQHPAYKEFKIVEIKDQIDLLAHWYLDKITNNTEIDNIGEEEEDQNIPF